MSMMDRVRSWWSRGQQETHQHPSDDVRQARPLDVERLAGQPPAREAVEPGAPAQRFTAWRREVLAPHSPVERTMDTWDARTRDERERER